MCKIDKELFLELSGKKKSKFEALYYLMYQAENSEGEVNFSLSQLALAWNWHKTEVSRFLSLMQKKGVLTYEQTPKYTKIYLPSNNKKDVLEVITEEVTTSKSKPFKEKNKAILFSQSSYYYDYNLFEAEMISRFPAYSKYDIEKYHKSAQNWGQGKTDAKYKKVDWVLTIKNWIDQDEKNGKAILKNQENNNSKKTISQAFELGNKSQQITLQYLKSIDI
ncbi:MAG: hypothetical protein OHK0045_22900 [Raineya sp.]